jgi:SAM-dependent methyltransferase
VTDPAYDRIGAHYGSFRRPDPRIAAQVRAALGAAASVVNVGAGTGSYEPTDRRVVAVEPSSVMVGQRPLGAAPVVRGLAEALPFADGAFEAALAVLTVHHWEDLGAGLAELVRVAARIVVLTFDPDPHFSYWLVEEYLPEILDLASARSPGVARVAELLGAGRVDVVPIPADCQDGFNWAYWRRPEAYLDPVVRSCISGVALLPDELVEERMGRLRDDLASGRWYRRHADLLDRPAVDGGFRLVIRD